MFLENIIKLAIEEAKKSNYKYKVGAIIFKSNRIYAKGHNYQSRPTGNLHPELRHPYFSIHAEIDAISKLKRNSKNLDLLVIRIVGKKNIRLAMSKPCKYCQRAFKHILFNKIYFSNESGILEIFEK